MTGLQVFEKHPTVDAYRFGPSFTPYAVVAKPKRFTTAELLAQYWFAENMGHHPLQCAVLYRFACTPHFDEETP